MSILTSRCIVALQATHRLALWRVSFCRFVFLRFIKLYYGTLYNVYLCTCFPEWLHSKTKSLNRTSNPSIWDNATSFCKKMPSLWFNGCLAVSCSQNMGCNLPQWAWWCILQWPVVLYWLVCWVSKEGINNWRPFLKVKSNLWKASDMSKYSLWFSNKENRSDDITKTNSVKLWEWLAYPARTRWKMFTCQKAAANWWGDIHCKQCYALMTL